MLHHPTDIPTNHGHKQATLDGLNQPVNQPLSVPVTLPVTKLRKPTCVPNSLSFSHYRSLLLSVRSTPRLRD